MSEIVMTKDELRDLYMTRPMKEVCARLGGVRPARVYSLLQKAGIPRKQAHKHPVDITIKE